MRQADSRMAQARPRVAYVRHAYYRYAAHMHRNVQALVQAGFEVSVIVLRDVDEPLTETPMPGVTIYRLPVAHRRGGLARYLVEYAFFFLLATILLTVLHVRRRFDVVEIDNMPDALVFCAWLPRLTGSRVILYVADCMADLMVISKGLRPQHPLVPLLRYQEIVSTAFAHHALVPNAATARRLIQEGAPVSKIAVVLNSPGDEDLFTRRPARLWAPESGRLRIVTHGTLTPHYGIQVLLAALPHVAESIPGVRLDIYGDGEFRHTLEAQARELGVASRVHFWGFVPHDKIPERLAEADVAYAGPLIELLANKMLEYQALGIPMVLSRSPAAEEYFPETCVTYFRAGDSRDLAHVIIELHREPRRAADQAERAWDLYDSKYRWSLQREAFLALYNHRPSASTPEPERRMTLA